MSGLVRTLDSWESYFATLNRQVPIHFVMAATLHGVVDEAQWVHALRIVQQRHILLRSAIRPDGLGALTFVEDAAQPIPVTFLPRSSDADLLECYAQEVHAALPPDASPLLRVSVLSGGSQTDLVVACHHAIADAMSVASLLRDLVNAANGNPLCATAMYTPSSADALWQERYPKLVPLSAAPPETGPARRYLPETTALPYVETATLSAPETAELREAAHQWGVSVHAMLCAAFVQAGAGLSSQWRDHPVRVVTPVDLRERFGLKDEVCLAITAFGLAYSYSEGQSLRSLAEAMQRDLQDATSDAALYTATRNLAGLMQGDWEMELLPRLVAFSPAYEIMVSNLRVLDFPVPAGPLDLQGIRGPNTLSHFEGQHSFGVSTYAGRLSLTHASYDSTLRGLLDGVMQVLRGPGLTG